MRGFTSASTSIGVISKRRAQHRFDDLAVNGRRRHERDAHEELIGRVVPELGALSNIAADIRNSRADGRNNPGLVLAMKRQDPMSFGHGGTRPSGSGKNHQRRRGLTPQHVRMSGGVRRWARGAV
jgi:hypothetical protein